MQGDACTRPLIFPKRPCNRPALPRIEYRIGSYSDFREHLMRRLDASPELTSWTHREPDDPGIALLECAAVLGDILTFYQELYANEAFLRTARWRSSVAELVRLAGYRLAPGLGGRATFAIELRGGEPVTVPTGFSLQLELEGLDEPAAFETQAELVAHPELSRFFLHRPLTEPQLQAGATELWIQSNAPIELEPDDRLLLGTPHAGAPDRLADTQIVVVDEVSTLHGATIIRIQGALQRAYPAGLVAYRIDRSFRHFGHNAPPQEVGVAEPGPVEYLRSLVATTELGSGPLPARDVPLDAAIDDLTAGREVICTYIGCELTALWGGQVYYIAGCEAKTGARVAVIDGSPFTIGETITAAPAQEPDTVVRTIARVDAATLRLGSLTGASTVLGLDHALSSAQKATADIRTFTVHEVTSPRLQVRARPVDAAAATGRHVYFHGPTAVAALLEGRRLMLAPPGGEATTVVATTVALDTPAVAGMTDLHKVTLAADVRYGAHPQQPGDETTVVLGNLVDANQGKTEPEAPVGSGDGRSAFQTFKLPAAPLTYHHAPALTPPRGPDLEILVAGRTWTRVESLFGQGPDAEVYIVREDADGSSWVQFGDGGGFGARLPSGVENVTARMRTGAGARGPLKADTSVQTGRLDRLDAVQLPGIVAGGADPEEQDVARAAAPGRVQGLDRLVALSDFETEALAIPGVARASAVWGLAGGVPTVTVTVLMDGGREQEHAAVAAALRTAARERGPDRFEIDVPQGRFRDVRLHAEVAVAPSVDADDVLARVRTALGVEQPGAGRPAEGLFSLRERRFGQTEHSARVSGVIQNTDGVVWTRVVQFGEARSLKELARPLDCPADQVLRLVDSGDGRAFRLTAVASGGGRA